MRFYRGCAARNLPPGSMRSTMMPLAGKRESHRLHVTNDLIVSGI
jgi:hypothetical protein